MVTWRTGTHSCAFPFLPSWKQWVSSLYWKLGRKKENKQLCKHASVFVLSRTVRRSPLIRLPPASSSIDSQVTVRSEGKMRCLLASDENLSSSHHLLCSHLRMHLPVLPLFSSLISALRFTNVYVLYLCLPGLQSFKRATFHIFSGIYKTNVKTVDWLRKTGTKTAVKYYVYEPLESRSPLVFYYYYFKDCIKSFTAGALFQLGLRWSFSI